MRINDILFEFAPSGGGSSGDYFRELASAWYNGVFDTGSLPKGIKTQEDVERLLNRGIVCPDGKTRKLHIDYNSDFDGVEIYSDDYYEYGDHDDTIDSRTGQKWGPYDFMAFSDEDLSEGINEFVTPQAVAQDPGLEREKDVDVIFFGRPGQDYNAEDAWAALEEVLPAEYPAGSERAQYKVAEVAKSGGAVVTTKPLSVAKQLVATFNGYGIKARVDENLREFAANNSGDSGEEDVLHKYARMWWNGDDATQQKIEAALARMGWEIGEDEGGYDNGGVFVVRAGDENGRSYTSWAAEDLAMDENRVLGFLSPGMPTAKKTASLADMRKEFEKEPTTPLPNIEHDKDRDEKKAREVYRRSADEGVAEGHADQQRKIFKKNGKPVGEVGIDPEASPGNGQWYMTCYGVVSYGGYDSYEEAVAELKHCLKSGVAEGFQPVVPVKSRSQGSVSPERQKDIDRDVKLLNKYREKGMSASSAADRLAKFKHKHMEEQGVAEGRKKPEPPEADYGADYQDMVARVKKLAGLGPLKTQYDPQKRVYRNMPTAQQPGKK